MTDPISDMLSRIRNAGHAMLPSVELSHSKLKESIGHILKREGYIVDCVTEGKTPKRLKLTLKYQNRKQVIEGLQRVSKPGRRIYSGADGLRPVLNGLGISIISTSRGVISDREARQRHLGGEVLCELW